MLDALINYAREAQPITRPGAVYLVGAGPGELDMVTLKAVRILAEAEVILIDSLVNPQILQFAPTAVELIEVGKRAGRKSFSQQEIHSIMIDRARRGKRVVRLKGGDAAVFARGGEEMLALMEAGIEVSFVNGLTSGIAVPACLNIPLSHRDLAQSLVFAVGNSKPGGAEPDWRAIAGAGATIVIYMGLTRAREIAAQLIEGGLPASTPAAAVQDGTLPGQKAVFGSISALAELIERHGLVSPTLLVIGKVVALSPHWQSESSLSEITELAEPAETTEIAETIEIAGATDSTDSADSTDLSQRARLGSAQTEENSEKSQLEAVGNK